MDRLARGLDVGYQAIEYADKLIGGAVAESAFGPPAEIGEPAGLPVEFRVLTTICTASFLNDCLQIVAGLLDRFAIAPAEACEQRLHGFLPVGFELRIDVGGSLVDRLQNAPDLAPDAAFDQAIAGPEEDPTSQFMGQFPDLVGHHGR